MNVTLGIFKNAYCECDVIFTYRRLGNQIVNPPSYESNCGTGMAKGDTTLETASNFYDTLCALLNTQRAA